MARGGMNKFLDILKLSDPDDSEFENDLFDEEDDDYYDDDDDYEDDLKSVKTSKSKFKPTKATKTTKKASYDDDYYDDDDYDYDEPKKAKPKPLKSSSKLVPINNNRNVRSSGQVYVIKPTDFNDAQDVADGLKSGRPTVINMEGMGVEAAQRIIDFIGGACYALDGTLQAISGNIFIASPNNVEVTGDLREELLEYNNLPPDMGRF